ncbi:DUF4337 domain-containing protein [Paenibacillus elgii]|uniref:DUF4337 domain-containing protein n=1 Tax=Paenibacillus elgii TaxID=189691 RepID=UPI0013D1BC58|nr:DUF4337 domain-containing protein [Paenibacillus elgii]
MSQRIEELKGLHIKSKPEKDTFLKNLNAAAKSRNLAKLLFITDGFPDVVKGYDWVIDELFDEIERLTKEKDGIEQQAQKWTEALQAAKKTNLEIAKERDEYQKIADGYATDIRAAHKQWLVLQEANISMREALEWYGDTDNWGRMERQKLYLGDGGERARSVLAKIGEGEKP